jgi:hypothetical protein
MNDKVYLVIAQYDNRERFWNVVDNKETLQDARSTKKSHESDRDCSYAQVYEARELTDKELEG